MNVRRYSGNHQFYLEFPFTQESFSGSDYLIFDINYLYKEQNRKQKQTNQNSLVIIIVANVILILFVQILLQSA